MTPEEIQNVKLRRSLLGGYSRARTRETLYTIATELEEVLIERATLAKEAKWLRDEVARREHRAELEAARFLSARELADEVRASARQDAELVLRKAYKRAGELRAAAERDYEARIDQLQALEDQSRLVRSELREVLVAVLQALDEPPAETKAPTRPGSISDLERAVRELVGRIQRPPGKLPPSRLPERAAQQPTRLEPGAEAEADAAEGTGYDERVADQSS